MPTQDELIAVCEQQKREYLHDTGLGEREWDCLIMLIEDGTIDTWEKLAEYGITNQSNAS